ncbi:TonB C-terminal domain-containing protein [Novosphingobium sp. Rr 2-17]|uniref:TonB C-terminal domain-containing protein n=1 Tax=Novosphingobium sp. Rr 2-17 TaxID=555793 RepID=UPI0003011229|nr:TonB C-terminal domain-containing protein [Novosphingobium sp. Rr 2-17]
MGIRKDEGIGLVVAVALHVAVVVALLVTPRKHDVVKPPQRIEVTISNEASLTSTAPNPGQASPDKGPEQGEPAPAAAPVPEVAPAPPVPVEPAPKPEPAPRVIEKPQPRPEPKPVVKPQPKPRPQPKPAPKAPPKPIEKAPPPKPAPKAPAKPAAKPAPKPAEKAPPHRQSAIDNIVSRRDSKPAKTAAKTAPPGRTASSGKATTPPRKAGSSSFDDAFKEGTPGAKAPASTGTPASQIGASERSALNAAIGRQIKPHWQAPQGADAELLVTKVRFRLNRDGSLAGNPEVVSTTGQTDANQTQVKRHQEQAVRAVRLAAPFNLPDDLYEGWKVVTTNFDRRLSQ